MNATKLRNNKEPNKSDNLILALKRFQIGIIEIDRIKIFTLSHNLISSSSIQATAASASTGPTPVAAVMPVVSTTTVF